MIFLLSLVMLPVICKLLMKVTGKKQKEYFDIFEVQFSLGFITVLIYLCEAVSEGVRSFGSTLCTLTINKMLNGGFVTIVVQETYKK